MLSQEKLNHKGLFLLIDLIYLYKYIFLNCHPIYGFQGPHENCSVFLPKDVERISKERAHVGKKGTSEYRLQVGTLPPSLKSGGGRVHAPGRKKRLLFYQFLYLYHLPPL